MLKGFVLTRTWLYLVYTLTVLFILASVWLVSSANHVQRELQPYRDAADKMDELQQAISDHVFEASRVDSASENQWMATDSVLARRALAIHQAASTVPELGGVREGLDTTRLEVARVRQNLIAAGSDGVRVSAELRRLNQVDLQFHRVIRSAKDAVASRLAELEWVLVRQWYALITLVFVSCASAALATLVLVRHKRALGSLEETRNALAESQRQLNGIFNSLEDVVWSGSAKHSETLYMSPAAEKLYGHKPDEFARNTNLWMEVVHPEDQESVKRFTREVFQVGTARMEYRIIRPDGGVRWVLDRGTLARDAEGNAERLDGIVTDITERKMAELALERERAFSRSIIESSMDMIIVADSERHIVEFNRAAERAFGYERMEVIGREAGILYARHADVERVREQLAASDACVLEIVNVRKDGSQFPAYLSSSTLRDAGGRVTGFMGVSRDITAEKKSAERLAANEQRLRTLFDFAPCGLLLENSTGVILDANPALCDSLGFVREELIGKSAGVLAAPEIRGTVQANIDRILAGETLKHTVKSVRPDGGIRHVILNETRVALPEGGMGIIVASLDITSLVQAEQALAHSERLYRMIVQNSFEGIGIVTPEEEFVFTNPAADRIFGVEEGHLPGRNLAEFLDDAGKDLIRHQTGLRRRGESTKYELDIIRPDGRRRSLRITASPMQNEQDNLNATMAIFRDDTDLIRGQQALVRELSFLSEIEVIGRSILSETDTADTMRAICSAVTGYCVFDHAAIIHLSEGEGHEPILVSTIGTEAGDAADLQESEKEELITKCLGMKERLEIRHPRQAEGKGLVSILQRLNMRAMALVPLRSTPDIHGVLIGFCRELCSWDNEDMARMENLAVQAGAALANANLIHRLQETNDELAHSIRELKVADRDRERFYRFLVHDLNKPLAAIIGTAGRMRASGELGEKLDVRVERIEKAAVRLRDIVARLLEYEKIRRGEILLKPERIDLWEQAMEIARLLSERHPDHRVLIAGAPLAEAAPTPLFVHADVLQTGRILQNLLDNAFKYGAGMVDLAAKQDGPNVRIDVWNDGKSIPMEDHARVFQEFYRRRDDAPTETTGFGIGLAAVKELVERMGGRIWIEIPERGGSVFSVTLPMEDKERVLKSISATAD